MAAWSLPEAARAIAPEVELLCREHFAELIQARKDAAARAAREADRRYCACGREYFFRPLQRAALGLPCSWCKLGQPVTPKSTVPLVSLRVSADWYTRDECQHSIYTYTDEACEAKKVWRLPDGRIVCEKHGAGPDKEMITS